jgi:hypothetical protein
VAFVLNWKTFNTTILVHNQYVRIIASLSYAIDPDGNRLCASSCRGLAEPVWPDQDQAVQVRVHLTRPQHAAEGNQTQLDKPDLPGFFKLAASLMHFRTKQVVF